MLHCFLLTHLIECSRFLTVTHHSLYKWIRSLVEIVSFTMAWSAHTDPDQLTEHFADDATLFKQAKELANLIRSCRHMVAFTGAGVSTSAGIPDFRGPDGVWTCRAQGRSATARTSTIKAFPTPSHMALVALADAGMLKFLISQNVDGIHRRSGFPVGRLAELHGNSNLEVCRRCGKEYLR